MHGKFRSVVLLTVSAGLITACATTPKEQSTSLRQAEAPAWSLETGQDEMVVAVSPTGKALRVAGSAGLVVGSAVDLGVNAKYRRLVRDLLEGYDAQAVLEERLEHRLGETIPGDLRRVQPLGHPVGSQSTRDAEKARLKTVGRAGVDVLLDLHVLYGLYGPEGTMAAKVIGKLYQLPQGRKVWDEKLIVTSGPVLASTRLGDPTNRVKPSVSGGLTVDEEAIAAWSSDDGTTLRNRYEEAVDGAVSALLNRLGLAEEALGEYHLGKLALSKKRFEEAEAHFAACLSLEPGFLDAQNARAVTLAHSGKVNEAIALLETLVEAHADYGPAWFNLAWWYAMEKRDHTAAKRCYMQAIQRNVLPDKKLEKALAD